jgi:carbon monoxide dehydrogenase subunit G
MQMNDSQRIAAPQETVWAALNDPAILKHCIPGCQSLEMTSPTDMTATIIIKVGPVKATFGGKVTLSDLAPPNSYRITGEGSGGVAGFAKGGATVRLEAESADATILHYEVDAQIGGKLAQLGGRLIDSTSKKLAAEFFTAFAARVAAVPEASTSSEPAKKPWLNRLIGSAGAGCLLVLAAANWCCITGHVHTASDPLAAATICASASGAL